LNGHLKDIYKIFHPTTTECTFFLAAHRTFSKINHILRHKTSLSKYKKIETSSCILSDCNGIKLEINSKRNYRSTNTWELNSTHLKGQRVFEEIREEKSKKILGSNRNENTTYRPFGTVSSKGLLLLETVLRGKFIAMRFLNLSSKRSQVT
jgi:hypothetical protein